MLLLNKESYWISICFTHESLIDFRFSIFLQTGAESEPEEVAFVFDARFHFGESQNKIVTNHKKEGTWGTEEDGDCSFPFKYGEDFKIKIIVEDDSFKVSWAMIYTERM